MANKASNKPRLAPCPPPTASSPNPQPNQHKTVQKAPLTDIQPNPDPYSKPDQPPSSLHHPHMIRFNIYLHDRLLLVSGDIVKMRRVIWEVQCMWRVLVWTLSLGMLGLFGVCWAFGYGDGCRLDYVESSDPWILS